MEQERMDQRLEAIESKLEVLLAGMEETRRRQRELLELREDLGRIATDVFQSASSELEDVAPHFETADLVHLGKKLLRNTRNLSTMLDRLEGLSDFVKDAAPLQKRAFLELMATMDDLDRRGYFQFLAESRDVLDRIVSSFSPEDVRMLGENIVTILSTVRNFTQPQILTAVNNALEIYQHLEIDVEEKVTYRKLLREARSPDVRRGLMLGMRFLKNVSGSDRRTMTTGERTEDNRHDAGPIPN